MGEDKWGKGKSTAKGNTMKKQEVRKGKRGTSGNEKKQKRGENMRTDEDSKE